MKNKENRDVKKIKQEYFKYLDEIISLSLSLSLSVSLSLSLSLSFSFFFFFSLSFFLRRTFATFLKYTRNK